MENENEKKLKSTITDTTSLNKKAQPKPKPKPIAEKVKEALLIIREKALQTINNVIDYTLSNFTEIYNSTTNATNSNVNQSNNSQPRVNLNEEALTQELIFKARQDGDSKEVVLNNKSPNEQTMVGSSLIVDMDTKKIDATIQEIDKRLNPVSEIDTPEPETEDDKINLLKDKEEKTIKTKPESKDKNKLENKNGSKIAPDYSTPKPNFKFKPETPKPNTNKKKNLKIEESKPIVKPTPNFQITLEAMRNKFLSEQENNPHILEEQQFQTVLKPQNPIFAIRDANTVTGSISAIRQNLQPATVPDTVEDIYGVEQRKIKARLK